MKPQAIRIVGIPMDLGQQRRGVDMGPSAIRCADLKNKLISLGHQVVDHGNISMPDRADEAVNCQQTKTQIVAEVCQRIYKAGRACMANKEFPIFLGGDHSISIGTVAALSEDEPIGIIWVDAHGDFNNQHSSPSGNIHGMPVSVMVGDGPDELVNIGWPGKKVEPNHIVQIGIRDLDLEERNRLIKSGISVYTMKHIDESGMAHIARAALDKLKHVKKIHVSLDMDSLNPNEAPGVGTPVPGGLSFREAHLLMEILGASGRITSMDIVETNPILDHNNQTAELAVGLAASLLGEQIL